jgi:hypothetical protein
MPSETPRAPVSGDAIVVDGDMLDTAVIELFRNLRKTVNDKPKPEMNEALAEQRRCIHLLRAIDAFIKETWREPVTDALGVRRYLTNLATRIEQLNDGAVHPMFVSVGRRGGQPDQVEVWEGRMWACAAIECHMRSGKHKRKGAAEFDRNPAARTAATNATCKRGEESNEKGIDQFARILASGISAGQYERDRATPLAMVPGFSGTARHTESVDGQGQLLPESRGPGR